ncbi:hypothetical protein CRG98_016109 [Punica granatum]|uniref:Uncharacterized protein n=1 Tax=Punica granatum TaxID=22663 RepID=A0A2I0K4H7_PUNGR|nr:hypothetical protein CRG98_016109 [Punica granatum]
MASEVSRMDLDVGLIKPMMIFIIRVGKLHRLLRETNVQDVGQDAHPQPRARSGMLALNRPSHGYCLPNPCWGTDQVGPTKRHGLGLGPQILALAQPIAILNPYWAPAWLAGLTDLLDLQDAHMKREPWD